MKKRLMLTILMVSTIIFGQEVCDDAIDNDGDGLIDLNDPDCDCDGVSGFSPLSLIPNPSFEDYTICPDSVAQLDRAENWVQASDATTDYYNDCDFNVRPNFVPVARPLPDGQGWVGFHSSYSIFTGPWSEYAGNCLTNTLEAGRTYTLGIWLEHAFGKRTIDFTLFGAENCSELPWTKNFCPEGNGTWQKLTDTMVTIKDTNAWQQVIFSFTPVVDINAVALGGPCATFGANYYYMDDLQIMDSVDFAQKGKIIETTACGDNVELEFQVDTVGWTCQWYKDGIALVGETNSKLDVSTYGTGKFSVRYVLETECDIIDYVFAAPLEINPDFIWSNPCVGGINPTFFEGFSSLADDLIDSWEWDFGDNSTGINKTTDHNFAITGSYDVWLRVTTIEGCEDSIMKTITIGNLPTAAFEYELNGVSSATSALTWCLNDSANFVEGSMIAAPEAITTYEWNFGDGNLSSLNNPRHGYANSGDYNVQLVVTSDLGCKASAVKQISISPTPSSEFAVDNFCEGRISEFQNEVGIPVSEVDRWEWDFDDNGSESGLQNPSHTFSEVGDYTVSLVVVNNDGCADTTEKQVSIDPIPTADFRFQANGTSSSADPLKICLGDEIIFQNVSAIPIPGNISTYAWNFGNANFSLEENPKYTYGEAGKYLVELRTISDNGCPDTIEKYVEVAPIPAAKFTLTEVCEGSATSFIDESTISSGIIEEWSWDFGDGVTSNEISPTHTFASAGSFNSTLTVTSAEGCENQLALNAVVNSNPEASFNIASEELNDQCEGVLPVGASFQNTSTSTNENTTYSWNLNYNIGDWIITSDIDAEIDTTYKNFGKYNACLIVANNECIDTTCKVITVLDRSELVEKVNIFSPNGDGTNDLFSLNINDELVTTFYCEIVNRWGVKVAELNGPSETWNGFDFQGDKCAEGVYYYVYSGNNWLGEPFNGHGAVQVVR